MSSQYKKLLFLLIGLLLISARCAEETEDQFDEEESYYDAMYGGTSLSVMRENALNDWEHYRENSNKLIAIAEANLNTIRVRIYQNDTGTPDKDLLSFYNKNEKKLRTIKKQLIEEENVFAAGPEKLSEVDLKDISKFKKTLRAKLLDLNISLEEVVEQGRGTENPAE